MNIPKEESKGTGLNCPTTNMVGVACYPQMEAALAWPWFISGSGRSLIQMHALMI